MTRSAPRGRAALAAALASTALVTATALAAATPKPGFHYQTVETGNGGSVNVITLQATEDETLLVTGADPKCQDATGYYKGFSLRKPIEVSNGKFAFDGKATSTLADGPHKVNVDLEGKFTSSKQSKGSYTLEGCAGKVKFKTDWTLGG